MAATTNTPELERLFARGRERTVLPACGRERLVEAGAALAFLTTALAMAFLVPSPQALYVPTLAVLVIAYVISPAKPSSTLPMATRCRWSWCWFRCCSCCRRRPYP